MKHDNRKQMLAAGILALSLTVVPGNSLTAHANWNGEGSESSSGYTEVSSGGSEGGSGYSDSGFGYSGGDSYSAETINASQPRLMVSKFEIAGGSVKPDKETTLKITFHNYSSKKYVSNVKLTIQDESGDIVPVGTGTKFVSYVYAGESYTWETTVKASKTAAVGEHKLTVTAEYEDKYYTPYSNTDTLLIPVKQKTNLDYSGFLLPKTVVQESTESISITLMNTGKSQIRNAKINWELEGLTTGGTTFIGEIEAGASQTASINFQVDSQKTGPVKGTAHLTYEDEYGKEYTIDQELSTTIEKKKEQQAETTEEKKEESKIPPYWWAYLLGGMGSGSAATFGGMRFVKNRKQMKEDELRL